jgi:hypothetical protein
MMNDSTTNQSLYDKSDFVSSNSFEGNVSTNSINNNNNNDTMIDPSISTNDPSLIITGFMMGLVAVFSFLLCYMLLPLFLQWVRRKIPVTTAQVNRRYETIEGWLITKVCFFSLLLYFVSIILVNMDKYTDSSSTSFFCFLTEQTHIRNFTHTHTASESTLYGL